MIAVFFSAEDIAKLLDLRQRAALAPVNVRGLSERINGETLRHHRAKEAHMKHNMGAQTVDIAPDYSVTFSIEVGHPCGVCRHLSMSRAGDLPPRAAFWAIALELGFVGDLDDRNNTIWPEDLIGKGRAVNVVQPIYGQPG